MPKPLEHVHEEGGGANLSVVLRSGWFRVEGSGLKLSREVVVLGCSAFGPLLTLCL